MEKIIETPVAIVLAAGKGVRMKSDLPKVLHPLNGKPLVGHVVDSLNKAGIAEIIAVVGYRGESVAEALTGRVKTVWQREQLGTGHAVLQAENELAGRKSPTVIACGDVPLIKPETFRSLINMLEGNVKAVVLTMKPPAPKGYGRIVRDSSGAFSRIVEEKDASPEEKLITEVNSGTYAFDPVYLFEGLKRINTDNAQKEYYLPDALNYIISSGCTVETVCLKDPVEGSGINSPEELENIEKHMNTQV
jgi:bifunctional UDP-N-acetylglucosamine pyrophosphorylase/glucosamine-1-phosphate N-acetyltransferase